MRVYGHHDGNFPNLIYASINTKKVQLDHEINCRYTNERNTKSKYKSSLFGCFIVFRYFYEPLLIWCIISGDGGGGVFMVTVKYFIIASRFVEFFAYLSENSGSLQCLF